MLFITVKTGTTYNRRVYREGEIFEILPSDTTMWRVYGLSEDITAEELKSRFKGEELFRLPTDDEIKKAYGEGKVDLEQMSADQKKIIKTGIKSKAAEMRVLSEQMQKEAEAEDEEEEEKKKG